MAERSYSIASAPGEPVAITVERLDDGEVSPYLTDELRAGDDLELRGPSHRAGPGTCGGWSAALLAQVAWPTAATPLAYVCGPSGPPARAMSVPTAPAATKVKTTPRRSASRG